MQVEAKTSSDRLPQAVRRLVETEPSVAGFLNLGMELGDVLCSREWAAQWAAGADQLLKRLLRWVLLRHGAVPFEEERTEAEAVRDGTFTGAEIRVGLARLRRAGILFAVRKTWGERLYYLPADMVPVWQRLMLPMAAEPIGESEQETSRIQVVPSPFRLPLSLELLQVWTLFRGNGIPLTAKGGLPKPAAAKLASAMRLTADELTPLGLAFTGQDQIPAQAALAIDLGLCTGVLRKTAKEITLSAAGVAGWLPQSVGRADAELFRVAVLRYGSADPDCHLAACAIASCRAGGWFRGQDILRIGIRPAAYETWLDLLVSFGWAERGTCRRDGVFRLLTSLNGEIEDGPEDGRECFLVQPDGEIYVPPGVGLEARWKLETFCERVTADRLFVYRITKAACSKGCEAGWNAREIGDFLVRGSEAALPEPVAEALSDWFDRLGKVRIEEAVLLRTDGERTAAQLLDDPETASLLGEPAGSKDFIVGRAKLKALVSRLEKIGYPPYSPDTSQIQPETPMPSAEPTKPGWLYRQPSFSFYDPDRSFSSAGELFPGMAHVPPVWLQQLRSYHGSTRQEMIRKAIAWRTAVGLRDRGTETLFVPQSIHVRGEQWEVSGRWRTPDGQAPDEGGESGDAAVTLPADRFGELRIVLPAWETDL